MHISSEDTSLPHGTLHPEMVGLPDGLAALRRLELLDGSLLELTLGPHVIYGPDEGRPVAAWIGRTLVSVVLDRTGRYKVVLMLDHGGALTGLPLLGHRPDKLTLHPK